ncbi:HNH endonuclease [Clostridium sp. Marseille-QA1073]
MRKEIIDALKRGDTKQFYRSKEWRKKRKDIIKRDNNECQECKKNGRLSNAECVHHIEHLKDRIDLALTDSNLMCVCYNCHETVFHPEKMEEYKKTERFKNKERWE